MEHSSANSVLSFIIFNVVALFTHMESLILGDPGEVSRDDRMFVVKVYCKTFTTNILSSLLTAPRSPRMRISETKIHSKNSLRWQIIKQNDAELSVIFFFFFSNWDYSHTNYKQLQILSTYNLHKKSGISARKIKWFSPLPFRIFRKSELCS